MQGVEIQRSYGSRCRDLGVIIDELRVRVILDELRFGAILDAFGPWTLRGRERERDT